MDAKRRKLVGEGRRPLGILEVAVIEPTGQGYDQAGLASDQDGLASDQAELASDQGGLASDQAGVASDAKRSPHQLPSGRHGLLRSFVAANQRERILSAIACASAELGYAEMSVEAIIASAGVSRRTFYEHFRNKEDAFLAAYDRAVRVQARHIRRAYLKETTVRERLRASSGSLAMNSMYAAMPARSRSRTVVSFR